MPCPARCTQAHTHTHTHVAHARSSTHARVPTSPLPSPPAGKHTLREVRAGRPLRLWSTTAPTRHRSWLAHAPAPAPHARPITHADPPHALVGQGAPRRRGGGGGCNAARRRPSLDVGRSHAPARPPPPSPPPDRAQHANIISLKDLIVNVEDDELYVVMELYDTDLHRIIQSPQALGDAHFKHFL